MARDVFLIGGGREPDGVAASHRPFVAATGGGPIACVVADEGDGVDAARWRGGLRSAGARDVEVLTVARGRPLAASALGGAAGVYVAGGLTPLYRELLAGDTTWLPEGIPYAGFSAGAAIAARHAIVGGWRIAGVQVCDADAGEDLDEVAPEPGLALVDVAVDVHATQWGTLSRAVHAVAAGLVAAAWAIDEHTGVHLPAAGGDATVAGHGSAYAIGADGSGRATITVKRPSSL